MRRLDKARLWRSNYVDWESLLHCLVLCGFLLVEVGVERLGMMHCYIVKKQFRYWNLGAEALLLSSFSCLFIIVWHILNYVIYSYLQLPICILFLKLQYIVF